MLPKLNSPGLLPASTPNVAPAGTDRLPELDQRGDKTPVLLTTRAPPVIVVGPV